MSESPLLQTPRHKFFAFSAVGVAMVCLPLVQVLRYQHDDLRQLDAERKLLDPVSQAVHAQFGILAHRQVSFDLLSGHTQLESTRAAVQSGVDQQLDALSAELTSGLWIQALTEARDLRHDWQKLARQVSALALTPQASNDGHTLRVEQMLQVMDLVSMPVGAENVSSPAPGGTTSHPGLANLQTGARVLLRLAQSLLERTAQGASATRTTPGAAPDLPPRLLALQQLLTPVATQAAQSSTGQLHHPLAEALAEVALTARQVQAAGELNTQAQTERSAALQRAWHAQQTLFDQAVALTATSLTQQRSQLEQQRLALLALLTALGTVALVLARSALRPWRVAAVPSASDPAARQRTPADNLGTAPPSRPELETHRVMDRLRQPRRTPVAGPDQGQRQDKRQSEDTQPPLV